MTSKSVFIVGPGFIGWNIVDFLVAEGYSVTGLVRRKEHADGIQKSGGQAILGDLHDHDLIAKETQRVGIVFHTATADDLPSVEAVLDGVKRRAADRKSTIFIHTSGTTLLDDGAKGGYKDDNKIYYDNKRDAIDALDDDAPHRPIDLAVVRAQKELGDQAKLAIMIPPTVYGYVNAHRRVSIQVPFVTKYALRHGYAPHVGKGLSVESHVHVLDLARAYMVLLHAMESQPPSFALENPYFFCENGLPEFSWKEMAEEVAKGLFKAGRMGDAKSGTMEAKYYGEMFGDATEACFGANSRSRAVRLRELGWEPREKSIWESYHEDELPAILKDWDRLKQ